MFAVLTKNKRLFCVFIILFLTTLSLPFFNFYSEGEYFKNVALANVFAGVLGATLYGYGRWLLKNRNEESVAGVIVPKRIYTYKEIFIELSQVYQRWIIYFIYFYGILFFTLTIVGTKHWYYTLIFLVWYELFERLVIPKLDDYVKSWNERNRCGYLRSE